MSDTSSTPRAAETYDEAEQALLSRWPETRLEPSLDRIRAFTELLGDPQHAYPVIHLTGTNGKTSTSRMIDALLRALGLRTGRFTSPHVESIRDVRWIVRRLDPALSPQIVMGPRRWVTRRF